MGRYASDTGGGEFQQLSAGTHLARCYSIVDLGTQRGEYQGQPTVRQQIIIRWEVPGEQIEFDGESRPMTISKFYTCSLSTKANLRHDLEAWRGKAFTAEELMGFDLENIVGAPAMVTVTHNDKGKARVLAVAGLPKGTKCPPQVHDSEVFWIDPWDQQSFERLPEGFQKIIKESDEYKARSAPPQHKKPAPEPAATAVDDFADDILF